MLETSHSPALSNCAGSRVKTGPLAANMLRKNDQPCRMSPPTHFGPRLTAFGNEQVQPGLHNFSECKPSAPAVHERAHAWVVGVVMRAQLRYVEGQKTEQETSIVRILLVDDYLPWRHFVPSMLQRRPHLQIVGECSDGLKAVQSAKESEPDLILMDIGIPTLNGIEAARRILEFLPEVKIIFVTENRSAEVAEHALRTGGQGYVIKSSAASELLSAVEAVLQGNHFVSASVVD